MKQKLFSAFVILPALAIALSNVVIFTSCNVSPPPVPTATPDYGIYDGQPRPECTCLLTRTDLVAPSTADTVNWGNPVKLSAPLNTNCPEDDAEISDDGSTLFYYWSPYYGPDNNEILTGTTGVYMAQKTGGPGEFGPSKFIELRKNSQGGAGDGHPRYAGTAGKIFFHSIRAANTGWQLPVPVNDMLDIYSAAWDGTSASPASNLGPAVNSEYTDGEPEINPAGTKVYFASARPGGLGGLDIYCSEFSAGQWSTPVNIGAPVNTSDTDSQPAFAANDPDTMYFISDRNFLGMAIYSSHYNGSSWETPVLVMQGQVGSPSLTADGSLLYFVHILTDGDPVDPVFSADIYYAAHK